MNKYTKLLLCTALSLFATPSLMAEDIQDFGSRNVGQGGLGSTLGRGATGFYYNPANVGARPWEQTDMLNIDFDIPVGIVGSIQGGDFRFIFDTVEAANDLLDQFDNGAFDISSNSLTFNDLASVFDIFQALDELDSLNGQGFMLAANTGLGVRFNNLWMPRDGLGFNFSMHAVAGASPIVDLDSLLGYRLTDESGAQFDQLIDIAITNGGGVGPTPSSTGGQAFSAQLQGAGYSATQADALAAQAENAGINFGGKSAGILFDFLVNTRNGTGQSLESGANPLEGNGSGFLIRGLAFYQMGVSYGFGITDWISVGATLNLYKATTFSKLLLIEDMDSNGVRDTMSDIQNRLKNAASADGDADRFNYGLDLGIILTPQIFGLDGLTLSLSGKNLNGPEFMWDASYPGEPALVRFDPLIRVGAAYTLMRDSLPLTFAIEADMNKIGSDILPNYHTQFIRGAVTFEPFDGWFGLNTAIGFMKNVADADQATIFTGGVGLRIAIISLNFAGQVGLDGRNFGTSGDSEIIPQWIAGSITLGIRTNF
ncbi:conjugal transfer protein TraF [Planctomycetota bacterium]|nr:conjugal transfer protein TraF [Planctomycetota bacterium]